MRGVDSSDAWPWCWHWGCGRRTRTREGRAGRRVPDGAVGGDGPRHPRRLPGRRPARGVLLDAFNAAPDVSNWVTAGNAMNTLAGKGISVAAPAGGAWSLYTNWEQDGSRQWETFLSDELPDWLAANKGLAPGGHGIVGAAQGGTGALMVADLPPRPLPVRRLAVGLPHPVGHHDRTAPSPPGWRSSAASTPATCGVCHSWAGGSGTTPTCTPVAGGQQHPAVGLQPGHADMQRPGRDDRLLRPGAGQQPVVLPALPRHRRPQRPLRLPDERQPRLGRAGRRSWRRCRANWPPPSGRQPGFELHRVPDRAAGTLEECSRRFGGRPWSRRRRCWWLPLRPC